MILGALRLSLLLLLIAPVTIHRYSTPATSVLQASGLIFTTAFPPKTRINSAPLVQVHDHSSDVFNIIIGSDLVRISTLFILEPYHNSKVDTVPPLTSSELRD